MSVETWAPFAIGFGSLPAWWLYNRVREWVYYR